MINIILKILSMRKARTIAAGILFCNLAFAAATAVANTDIYLAIRTDGRLGSGTPADPFDASASAKFDALLARFTANTTFHYAPGTYPTTGWHYRRVRTASPGCIHLGAGTDQTIIQLVGAAALPDGVIFGTDYDQTCDGFQLQNLTLDVNASHNPMWSGSTGAFGAVNLQGNNVLISGCKIINFGTSRRGCECFPVFIYPGPAFAGRTFTNIQVQNCTFTNPVAGNRDGLSACVIGSDNTVTLTNAAVTGCSFLDIESDFTYSHAFSANLVQNNFVKGCATGFYREPVQVEKPAMAVLNNTFIDVTIAAQINFHANSGFGSLTFSGNKVVLRDQYNTYSAAVNVVNTDSQGPLPVMQALTMTNNQVIGVGQDPLATPAYRAIDLRCPASNLVIKSAVIQGNALGSSIPNGFEFDVTRSSGVVPNLQYGVNRYANGQPVPIKREM
jgi:hypothetical protein